MNAPTTGSVINMATSQTTLRHHFLAWQCRLRQHAVRKNAGRPSPGMMPDAVLESEDVEFDGITILIVPEQPRESTAEFRNMVRRTQDPSERYEAALKYLAANYYHNPKAFSDRMTAMFAAGSSAAARLLAAGQCSLAFAEKRQTYRLPCAVAQFEESEDAWQATYWHNCLFSPAQPAEVSVLSLVPNWSRAEAEPGVE